MSYEAVAAAVHHSKASTSSRLVLITIAHFEGDQGAWPSQSTLAEMTGLSVRSVRRAIHELAELFELDVIASDGAGYGARKSNRYFVILQCPADCDGSIAHRKKAAEVVSLTATRRAQYRSKMTAIEATHDRNRGQKMHQ
jgi:hypothetical protein